MVMKRKVLPPPADLRFRLVEKDEFITAGDVAGYRAKVPIDMNNWAGSRAGQFNQAVFRPLKSYEDMFQPLVKGPTCP
jgi:hypothetical protein